MKRFVAGLLSAALLFGSVSFAFSADEPKKEKANPEAQFKKLDANGDGKLSLEEFLGKRKPEMRAKAEEQFKKKDKNSDGFLSLEEFAPPAKKPKQ